ncbi:Wilms tumor protein-like protein, partial [Stegodyphus mimosarum]
MSVALYPNCSLLTMPSFNWSGRLYQCINQSTPHSLNYTCLDCFTVMNEPTSIVYPPNSSKLLWREDHPSFVPDLSRIAASSLDEQKEIFHIGNQSSCGTEMFKKLSKRKFENAYESETSSSSSKTTRIWRPFLPASPSQSQENLTKSSVEVKNEANFQTRNTVIPSIIPSRVKIGFSKTSVFTAVKKKNYCCSQCPSRYANSTQLMSHTVTHSSSKPYICEYPNCSKTFSRNEELTRHRRIHSGYKPHICNVCDKRFGRKDHLSKHLKTHLQASEKKIYICSIPGCGHRYTRSDALTRHKSTVHFMKKAERKVWNQTK